MGGVGSKAFVLLANGNGSFLGESKLEVIFDEEEWVVIIAVEMYVFFLFFIDFGRLSKVSKFSGSRVRLDDLVI